MGCVALAGGRLALGLWAVSPRSSAPGRKGWLEPGQEGTPGGERGSRTPSPWGGHCRVRFVLSMGAVPRPASPALGPSRRTLHLCFTQPRLQFPHPKGRSAVLLTVVCDCVRVFTSTWVCVSVSFIQCVTSVGTGPGLCEAVTVLWAFPWQPSTSSRAGRAGSRLGRCVWGATGVGPFPCRRHRGGPRTSVEQLLASGRAACRPPFGGQPGRSGLAPWWAT